MIPGLSTLKGWVMGILAAIAGLAVIWGQHQKNKRIEDEHEDVENAQRVERQDAKITAQGLTDEALTADELKDKSISDYFRKT